MITPPLYNLGADAGVVRYRSGDSLEPITTWLSRCGETLDLTNIEVTLTRVRAVASLDGESSVSAQGEISVQDSGWDLQIPFALEHVCSVHDTD